MLRRWIAFAVKWVKPGKDEGKTLEQLKFKPGNWNYSIRYSEAHTAKEWGMIPSQFRLLSDEDKATMIAFEIVSNKIQEYEQQVQQAEAQKK